MARSSLTDLEAKDEFVGRHIGPSEADIGDMLDVLGYGSLDELVDTAVPDSIRQSESLTAPPCTEGEVVEELRDLSEENDVRRSMIGLGYHDTVTPPVILRNVLENPGWYTAYTPYQAEISQGRLEALLNFQQMVIDLTGMPLANASMLDEATAAAEAVTMMHRVGKSKAETVFVARDCHPQTIAVIETRAKPLGLGVVVGDPFTELEPDEVFGAVLQVPATDGTVHDYRELVERLHAVDALVTVACDLLGCALLTPPGEWGADVVVGSAQRFGVPLGFGGPHAAFLATHEAYKRSVPGRLIGVSKDAQGRPALRMALQTREQHIRREKATSNICTAQVLLANIAGLYAVWHGPGGLRRIAERVHRLAAIFAHGLKEKGVDLTNGEFFDTVTVDLGDKQAAEAVHVRAFEHGINLRPHDDGRIGVAFDETTDRSDVEDLWRVFAGEDDPGLDVAAIDDAIDDAVPKAFRRTTPFLEHPVFNSHHSETGMMRYLRGLEEKDLALNRAMIPLGSCTMKLNAAAEMIPITLEGFARLHPFAPLDQATGYRKLIDRLEEMLTEITGFAAVSFQPNAGSQGEYAGLLAIRRYHEEAGDDDRDVCLIPSSAHGTNPASAILAGMRVVVVGCDKQGNVDVDDLAKKADEHRDRLGALMVTYPSTHGVFEREIRKICDIVHDAGGLVYMDGANLQAMVGLCRPGEFGPDVMHMNLHKTFCIPHGGGGPGVGPIGVVERLKPYLPNHPLTPAAGPETGPGAVAAAPWGSASILPISYAYIRLMGGAGLTKATKVAILNANYVATRLASHYKILYSGAKGLVAHECIIDTRPIQEAAGITVGDIAKRLMDYGFHGPTMSWPVMHTLMMEPTESEPKEELDRFCEAMIAIHDEAHRVESGDWPADDNPLVNAPHTADVALADDWPHPYSRETAVYPVPGLKAAKYWPAVGRIDDAYGDRHLVCTCPPLEDYRQEAAD